MVGAESKIRSLKTEKGNMKAVKLMQKIGLILVCSLAFSFAASAQETAQKTRERIAKAEIKTENTSKPEMPGAEKKADDKENQMGDKKHALTDEQNKAEAAEVLPYYNNYLTEYRLGPNDVISVEVFGQCPDYCKESITVPPTAKISYPLIREGVFVGGRTVEEIQAEIAKKLDEYIIDPKVTVTLVKAMSARYSVLGKVATPGVHVMDRKVSLYEAIAEAGGVTKEGDKKRVTLYRFGQDGRIEPRTVDLTQMEKGKSEMIYLNPGDQVFVPDAGFRLRPSNIMKILQQASVVRLLFGVPF
jgi:polysaccharide export outer membrane protein